MKINTLHSLVRGVIILLTVTFLVGIIFNVDSLSVYSRLLIFPLFICLYFITSEEKSILFTGFLLSCALGELFRVFGHYAISGFSTAISLAYTLGYLSLILYIFKSMKIERLVKFYLPHVLVLAMVNFCIVFTLVRLVLLENKIEVYSLRFFIESLYNIMVLLLFSLALLSYFYKDTKRRLLLFLASASIVFSETVQAANFFMTSNYFINVVYSMLLVVGFCIVYVYITSEIKKRSRGFLFYEKRR